MSDAAVVFDEVWKKFRRGERHDTLRDLLPSLAKKLLGRNKPSELEGDREFWAVRDASFTVRPGEALGIIGPNGAGKSTTLKLLTNILRPTRGRCAVRGRVGALIEVAAGFHPDLTGRENIMLQGSIMGMRREDIQKRQDEIIAFSGIEAFVDTPVKRFSSGMQARLGFSIAAHLDPDVLFVDEVLSVGDISFQAKCLARMRQRTAAGMTTVFVSHNLQAVAELCRRALVFGNGRLLFDGATAEALDVYLDASRSQSAGNAPADAFFKLCSASLVSKVGSAEMLAPHTECRFEAEFECLRDASDVAVGFIIERTRDLLYCYGASSNDVGAPLISARKGERVKVAVDFIAHFVRGHYRINLNIRQPAEARFLYTGESLANFSVSEASSYDGVTDIEPKVTLSIPEFS